MQNPARNKLDPIEEAKNTSCVGIGGFLKSSFIDYPGYIAAIAYIRGCAMRCPWCQNPSLVDPKQYSELYDPENVVSFLELRKKQLDGLVITGGEPTLWSDLTPFMRMVKQTGLRIKLDTNGTNPRTLTKIIDESLINYVAMDVKASLTNYSRFTGVRTNTKAISQSIDIIKNANIDYEFRTTYIPSLHTKDDLQGIAKLVEGSRCFALQGFRPGNCLDISFNSMRAPDTQKLNEIVKIFEGKVEELLIRN